MQLSEETKQQLILEVLGLKKQNQSQIGANVIGKICMFRTYSAGVHFGKLIERDGVECLVEDARRVFYWDGACSLSQLAMEASKNLDGCKISMPVPEIILTQVIEIIPMNSKAYNELSSVVWKK